MSRRKRRKFSDEFKAEAGDPWWCPLQVEGLGPSKVRGIAGEDALQALLLALKFARDYLPEQAERAGGRVFWLTDDFDAVFDERRTVQLLEDALAESLDALEGAEPLLRVAGDGAQGAATIASRVILKYRDMGDRPKDQRPPSHERSVFERAKALYFRLRDRYDGDGS